MSTQFITSIKPYPYQEEGLNALRVSRKAGSRRQLVVMATGLGKTITAVLAIKEMLESQPGRVLVLCHEKYILGQWEKAFRRILGDNHTYGSYHGGAPKSYDAQFIFASFQSMANAQFPDDYFAHVVVDESHHSAAPTYWPTIEYFAKHATLLGLTATPERSDGHDITDIFGKPVVNLPLEVALGRELLAPVRYLVLTGNSQNAELPSNLSKLNMKMLDRTFFVKEHDEELVRLIAEHTAHLGDDLRMMVFCANIPHAERYAALLPNARAVHSKLRASEQAKRIKEYEEGVSKTIVTVNKFNEGVDFPQTNVVVLGREHGTMTGFLQQIGRALRPSKGKKEVLILDIAGNCERVKTVDDLRRCAKAVYDEYTKKSPKAHEDSAVQPFEVSVGKFEFDVAAKQILDVLALAKGGYTKAILREQLFKKKKQLGRTPTSIEVGEDKSMASVSTFIAVYGKQWNGILKENGLKPARRVDYTVEELILQMLDKEKELDGSPTSPEVEEDEWMASPSTIKRALGVRTWPEALEALGMEPIKLTKERVAKLLHAKKKQLKGRTPLKREVDDDPDLPAVSTILELFGTNWNGLLEAIGLEVKHRRERRPIALLVKQLKDKKAALGGRWPTRDEVNADRDMASVTAYRNAFKTSSWRAIITAVEQFDEQSQPEQ